jgi:hypothetical protein
MRMIRRFHFFHEAVRTQWGCRPRSSLVLGRLFRFHIRESLLASPLPE